MCGDPFEWVVAGSCSARAALTVEPDRAVGFGGAAILSIPIDELLPVDGDRPRDPKMQRARGVPRARGVDTAAAPRGGFSAGCAAAAAGAAAACCSASRPPGSDPHS